MTNQAILKKCEIFKGFSDGGLAVIEKICRVRKITAGTPIFVENMVAESMFVLKEGSVQLSLRSDSGQVQALGSLSEGQGFGELSLIIGGNRMCTATASTDCELLEIPRSNFAKLQKKKPQACLKLMMNIIRVFGKKIDNCKDQLKPLIIAQLDN